MSDSLAGAARQLAATLSRQSGVPVQVCLPTTAEEQDRAPRVVWSDGPTAAGMRLLVGLAVRDSRLVDVSALDYERAVTDRALAILMVRRASRGLDALDGRTSVDDLRSQVAEDVPYPERSTIALVKLARLVLSQRALEHLPALLAVHGTKNLAHALAS